ncbi:MAG: hypothetical protein ACYS7M_15730 [Planctomycetota bacterium]|jgi:hypothetical protein
MRPAIVLGVAALAGFVMLCAALGDVTRHVRAVQVGWFCCAPAVRLF